MINSYIDRKTTLVINDDYRINIYNGKIKLADCSKNYEEGNQSYTLEELQAIINWAKTFLV